MEWRRSPDVVYEVVDGHRDVGGANPQASDPSGIRMRAYDLQKFLTLNEVGTLVWQALDGVRGPAEIAAALMDRVDGVTLAEFERDIDTFIAETYAAGLVERSDGAN